MSYFRSKEDKRRLAKLYYETKSQYGSGAYYDDDKRRYIRYYPAQVGFTKFLKRYSNKRARKSSEIPQYSGHKKNTDYWWILT